MNDKGKRRRTPPVTDHLRRVHAIVASVRREGLVPEARKHLEAACDELGNAISVQEVAQGEET